MNSNDYIEVRRVRVPRKDVEEIEQQYGVKLVRDIEYLTLLYLDDTLKNYRKEHGEDPELVMLPEHPEYYYKHMVLNINFMGMSVPGSYNKPAWFKMPRSF